MHKLNIFILVLFTTFTSNAQIAFQKTYGGTTSPFYLTYSIQQTTDGGYIIVSSTDIFGAGLNDVYLIKTNVEGDTLWTKTFGGTGQEIGYSGQQTADGGYIVAGFTSSPSTSAEILLVKSDSIGNLLWSKTYGDNSQTDEGYFIQQTTDGGYIIVGFTNSFGAGNSDIYLLKTNSNGDSLWTRVFGGISNDIGESIQLTQDGGFIIVGTTFGAGNADVYLIRTDSIGNLLWSKAYGGLFQDGGSYAQQTTDGGFIITGYVYNSGSGYDLLLIKVDSVGNLLWTKSFGGPSAERGYYIQQTIDEGFIITGYTYSFGAGNGDVYVVKTDANGDTLWTRSFGGSNEDVGMMVKQTSDSGYIVSGHTVSFGVGGKEIFIIKTDSLGNSGCYEGSTATVVTSPLTQVITPATIVTLPISIVTTPTLFVGSGGAVTTLCNVSINEISQNNILLIHPNPSSGSFFISFDRMILIGNIEISNILGETILTDNISRESQKEIQLTNILKGLYFVRVFDGERSYCQKLVLN